MKRIAVLVATGFEEIEALAPVDILRRAGFEVTMIGVLSKSEIVEQSKGDNLEKHEKFTVTGSHQITVTVDQLLCEVEQELYDAIVLPGGMPGAKHLKESEAVLTFVRRHSASHRLVNAICAAPIVLNAAGVLDDKRFTCYPGFEKEIHVGHHTDAFVEQDGRLLTGCGPAAAFEFAYRLVEALGGDSTTLQDAMQYRRLFL